MKKGVQAAICCPCGNQRILALGLRATCHTLKRQDAEYFGGLREHILERDGYASRVCGDPGPGVHHREPLPPMKWTAQSDRWMQVVHSSLMADEWIKFPEGAEIELLTEDLCRIYGSCALCPGHVTYEGGIPIFCTHECHRVDLDA